MYFKHNDLVVVIAGSLKGRQGRVMKVDDETHRVWVQGLNMRFKHTRRSQKLPRGGRVQKEAAMDASNLQLVDPKTNRPTRIGFRVDASGKKVRYAKRSGEPV
jgi:large subunit ribosomal protein L24